MDVWRLTVAALRRWYVLLPALACTALLVAAAGRSVAPEYQTTGAVLLSPPPYRAGPANPYSGSSAPTVLQIVATGSEVRSRLASMGLEPGYEVQVTPRTPILRVSVRSASQQKALATGEAVFEALRQELLRGQRGFGVPQQAMSTLTVLDAPDTVSETGSGALRVQAVVGLLGGLSSVALAVLFDDLLLLLRRRRERRRGVGSAQEVAQDEVAQDEVAQDGVEPDTAPEVGAPASAALGSGDEAGLSDTDTDISTGTGTGTGTGVGVDPDTGTDAVTRNDRPAAHAVEPVGVRPAQLAEAPPVGVSAAGPTAPLETLDERPAPAGLLTPALRAPGLPSTREAHLPGPLPDAAVTAPSLVRSVPAQSAVLAPASPTADGRGPDADLSRS